MLKAGFSIIFLLYYIKKNNNFISTYKTIP